MKYLVGVILLFCAGCQNSAVDIAFKGYEKLAVEGVARQHASTLGFTANAKLLEEPELIKQNVYRVYLKEGGRKIRVRVENGKAVKVDKYY